MNAHACVANSTHARLTSIKHGISAYIIIIHNNTPRLYTIIMIVCVLTALLLPCPRSRRERARSMVVSMSPATDSDTHAPHELTHHHTSPHTHHHHITHHTLTSPTSSHHGSAHAMHEASYLLSLLLTYEAAISVHLSPYIHQTIYTPNSCFDEPYVS